MWDNIQTEHMIRKSIQRLVSRPGTESGSMSNDTPPPAQRQCGKPTMAEVAACFHMPIGEAAKKLGVGQTSLKILCRSNGVSRWPFRKIKLLQNGLNKSNTKAHAAFLDVAKAINTKWLDVPEDGSDASCDEAQNPEGHREAENCNSLNGENLCPRSSGPKPGDSFPAGSTLRSVFLERRSGTEPQLNQTLPLFSRRSFDQNHSMASQLHPQWRKVLLAVAASQAETNTFVPPMFGTGSG
eukprot:scaffold202403_cov33-Prasinocladus_malaysianus.AAC.1